MENQNQNQEQQKQQQLEQQAIREAQQMEQKNMQKGFVAPEAKTVINGKVVSLKEAQQAEEKFNEQNTQTGVNQAHNNNTEAVQAGAFAQNSQQLGQQAQTEQQNIQAIKKSDVQSGQQELEQHIKNSMSGYNIQQNQQRQQQMQQQQMQQQQMQQQNQQPSEIEKQQAGKQDFNEASKLNTHTEATNKTGKAKAKNQAGQ